MLLSLARVCKPKEHRLRYLHYFLSRCAFETHRLADGESHVAPAMKLEPNGNSDHALPSGKNGEAALEWPNHLESTATPTYQVVYPLEGPTTFREYENVRAALQNVLGGNQTSHVAFVLRPINWNETRSHQKKLPVVVVVFPVCERPGAVLKRPQDILVKKHTNQQDRLHQRRVIRDQENFSLLLWEILPSSDLQNPRTPQKLKDHAYAQPRGVCE